MAKYREIADWVKEHYRFTPKTCWIAHVKSECGLPVRTAPNRADPNARQHPCPEHRRDAIVDALKHHKMI